MNDKKINKIIHNYLDDGRPKWSNGQPKKTLNGYSTEEFMCFDCCIPIPKCICKPSIYTKSLDALIPAVEKLMLSYKAACGYSKCLDQGKRILYNPIIEWVGKNPEIFPELATESPSLALATACAKVIKEL